MVYVLFKGQWDCKFVRSCRLIIRNAVNASEHDSVIFCGSGTTGAVERLIHILNHPKNLVGPLFTGCYIRVSVNFKSLIYLHAMENRITRIILGCVCWSI